VIRPFFPLGRSRAREYARFVRAFRNAAAIALVLLAVASLAALAVASRGGSSRGDSGAGQYGAKQECRTYGHGSQHRNPSGCPRRGRRAPH
jgi:hypothetical protein